MHNEIRGWGGGGQGYSLRGPWCYTSWAGRIVGAAMNTTKGQNSLVRRIFNAWNLQDTLYFRLK